MLVSEIKDSLFPQREEEDEEEAADKGEENKN